MSILERSSDLSLKSLENLLKGVLALEQGEAKTTFAAIKKGARKAEAQNQIPRGTEEIIRKTISRLLLEAEEEKMKKEMIEIMDVAQFTNNLKKMVLEIFSHKQKRDYKIFQFNSQSGCRIMASVPSCGKCGAKPKIEIIPLREWCDRDDTGHRNKAYNEEQKNKLFAYLACCPNCGETKEFIAYNNIFAHAQSSATKVERSQMDPADMEGSGAFTTVLAAIKLTEEEFCKFLLSEIEEAKKLSEAISRAKKRWDVVDEDKNVILKNISACNICGAEPTAHIENITTSPSWVQYEVVIRCSSSHDHHSYVGGVFKKRKEDFPAQIYIRKS